MLTFSFTGASGEMTVGETLTSGMVGKEVQIDLSGEWEGLTKTAVFIAGYICRAVALTGSSVVIPQEILRSPYQKLRVGVRGDSDDGTLVIPTIMAEGPYILPGADPGDDTGEEKTGTDGGTATESDIAEGQTAYVGGKLITGTLPKKAALTRDDAEVGFYFLTGSNGESGSGVIMKTALGAETGQVIVDGDTVVTLRAPSAAFGDAAAADVLEGVTFTSAAGLQVVGTLAPAAELTLTDAKVGAYFLTGSSGESGSSVTMEVTLGSDAEPVLLGPGSVLTLRAPMSEFGTATKADVAAGKTFTSAAGLCISGTLEA